MTSQETFVTRLRRHRERSRISLTEIANLTRIKMELFEALERNDLENWPTGLYARAYVRAYASVIGLDPDETVDEFCRLFPQGNRRVEPTMREMAAIVASASEWRDEFGHATSIDRRQSSEVNVLPQPPRIEAAMARLAYGVRSLWTWVTRTPLARRRSLRASDSISS